MPNKKKNYTENQWQHFLWSDDILKPLAQIIVSKYRGSQENTPVRSSVKHGGGSVMVWGCICICAVGNLAKTDVNDYECKEVPSDFDPEFNNIWEASDWQQLYFYPGPKNTASIKAYLDRKTYEGTPSFLHWPPQSLGLTLM